MNLQKFLADYANNEVLFASEGIIEEEQLTGLLTITHEVLTSEPVYSVTFKQHESYTQGDEYNELSDVFDYDNIYIITTDNNVKTFL